jgi:hypothetical protein
MVRLTSLLVLLLVFLQTQLFAAPAACDTPTGLQATVSGNSATLTWNTAASATAYWVEVESEQNTPFYQIEVQVASNTYTVTGLVDSGLYKFKVRTKCGGDKSDWSEWQFFNTGSSGGGGNGGGNCGIPTGQSVSNNSGGSATLSWTAVSGANAYWVEIESENLTPAFNLEVLVNTSAYIVSGLSNNASYKFKVRAVCSGNQSDWSAWMFFVSGGGNSGGGGTGGACTAPVSITIANPTGTSASFGWAPVAGAIGYKLEIENASGNPIFFKDTATVSTNAYTVNGLTPQRSYKVKVRSLCSNGQQSDWTNWLSFNSSTGIITSTGGNSGGGTPSCDKPSGLFASDLTTTSALLSWKKSTGAISYAIRVEDGSNNSNNFLFSATSVDTFYTIAGLLAGQNYKFKVRTICGNDHSKWSKWKTFNTPPSLINPNEAANLTAPMLTGVSIAQADVLIYPNPVRNRMTLLVEGADPAQTNHIRILDLSGKVVIDQIFSAGSASFEQIFDFSGLNNGLYLLQWSNNEQVVAKKFLVQGL